MGWPDQRTGSGDCPFPPCGSWGASHPGGYWLGAYRSTEEELRNAVHEDGLE